MSSRKIWLAVVTSVVAALGVEAVSRVLVARGSRAVKLYRTTPLPTFWSDIDRAFGVWHPANASFRHAERCWDVTYHANSYGARDVERSRHSTGGRRHIVLGDSFIEGLAVPDGDRLTDRLNASTDEEFLNFGTSGDFGTVQELMLYRSLASSFDHSDVLLFVLPLNDFSDNDPKYSPPTRYRPYLRLNERGTEIYYTVKFEDRNRNELGPLGRAWNALNNHVYLLNLVRQPIERRMRRDVDRPYTSYTNHTPDEIEMMAAAIRELARAAHPRRVHVFMIPLSVDVDGYITKEERYPIAGQLQKALASATSVDVVDLLADFVNYAAVHRVPTSSFYLPCDGHWSSFGNAVAAEAVERHLHLSTRLEPQPN